MTRAYIEFDSKGQVLSTEAHDIRSELQSDGAVVLESVPDKWEEGLICVPVKYSFAAYIRDQEELEEFKEIYDYPKTFRMAMWLKCRHAKELVNRTGQSINKTGDK